MKKIASCLLLLIVFSGCTLPQSLPKEIAPLEFPSLAPTYTPLPIFPAETLAPEIITATPVTPSPTPA